LGAYDRPGADRAPDVEAATEGLDPVGEPAEAAARLHLGAASAVVVDGDCDHVVGRRQLDARAR
jgi:hypothetical protein